MAGCVDKGLSHMYLGRRGAVFWVSVHVSGICRICSKRWMAGGQCKLNYLEHSAK